MAVTKITAWQTSAGQCFSNKADAYQEELVHLVKTRGDSLKVSIISADALGKAIADHTFIVAELGAMLDSLRGPKDKKLAENVRHLKGRAESWLADAKQLQDDMDLQDEI